MPESFEKAPDPPLHDGNAANTTQTSEKAVTRREVLIGTAGTVGGALVARAEALLAQTSGGATETQTPARVPADPTKIQGRLPSELGTRSAFETPRRRVNRAAPSGESETPLQELHGIITPSDLHYERHHGGVPSIDPSRYSLLIHGLVERPLKLTLADLKRFRR